VSLENLHIYAINLFLVINTELHISSDFRETYESWCILFLFLFASNLCSKLILVKLEVDDNK
jgi:hypothetical protein